ILAVVPAVVNHSQTLDQTYEPYLKDWKLERLPKVDLAIFRLAVYEILQRPEVPFSVTLNEAVLLAKRYGSVSSSRYINGVLARISKPETNITPAAEPEEQAACGYHQTAAAAAGAADSQPADAAADEKKLTGAVPEAVRPAEQEALGGG
ncbi:MAG: transcription antitermination factor NusB, partial [Oscillospiraceae bacterium]|nr:transcription antitermination factor NusB [Oscillospiraceae bacterium]